MRIGITGHQDLKKRLQAQGAKQSEANAWAWSERVFGGLLESQRSGTVVISSLATGADQRLSRVAVEHNSKLRVVVPSEDYVTTFGDPIDRAEYEWLLSQAVDVIPLGYPQPSEAAFFAAGKYVVDHSDAVVAVWDGLAAEGHGGTGDVVTYALACGKPVIHMNPILQIMEPLEGNS
jgi:hypothetical protein